MPCPPPNTTDPDPEDTRCARRAQLRRRWIGVATVAAAVLLAIVVGVGVSGPASATVVPGAVRVVALAGNVDTVLDNIRNWLMGILAGLATVFLTVGGVRYVMAAGDPGEVAKAKTAFKSAGMGYALAALAPLVVTVLKGIVGA